MALPLCCRRSYASAVTLSRCIGAKCAPVNLPVRGPATSAPHDRTSACPNAVTGAWPKNPAAETARSSGSRSKNQGVTRGGFSGPVGTVAISFGTPNSRFYSSRTDSCPAGSAYVVLLNWLEGICLLARMGSRVYNSFVRSGLYARARFTKMQPMRLGGFPFQSETQQLGVERNLAERT